MIEGWNSEQAELLLGAMRTVADEHGDGGVGPIEQGLIDGAARHVFDLDPPAAGSPVEPDALAAALGEERQRAMAVQFLTLMPYADMTVAESEVALVDDYAEALGEDTTTLTQLHRIRDGHVKRALLDYSRRAAGAYQVDTPRLKKLVESIHQYVGDRAVAERYATLESYPEESLGRVFFDFYRARGFPLPGEKKSLGETLTPHDCAHILGGFNTDGTGEINVAGFEAGMGVDEFGYELLLEVILDFHLGIDFGVGLVGYVPKTGEMDPDQMMVGIRRGLDCNTDLIHRFDFWGVADRPVEDLRAEYGIVAAGPVVIPPPEAPATEA
ncbi:MAG: hypothetical protein AAGK32_09410 [Actinomycetota bacterium]